MRGQSANQPPGERPPGSEEWLFEDFAIDRDAEVPIGVQLTWAIRARIDDDRLLPGSRLPGLRDLAEALAINPNTVRSVYARLEQEGLVESRHGSGTFVASGAASAERRQASAIAAGAAREAIRTGVDPRDVAATLYIDADMPSGPGGAEMRKRARLRSQITALSQTLLELEAEYPSLTRPASQSSMATSQQPATARLLSSAELERTRHTLVRRLADLQSEIDALRVDGPADSTRPQVVDEPADASFAGSQGAGGESRKRSKKTTTRPATAGI